MITLQSLWALVKDAVSSWLDDRAPSMGAALAYYTLFSISPLLLIVIALAGLIFGKDAARGEILGQLNGLMGDQGAQAVQLLLASVNKPAQGMLATLVGGGLLLVGSTTVFAELQDALDRIWRAPVRQRSSSLITLARTRLLSFGMILGIGFLLMVSLIVSAGLSALGAWWSPMFAEWQVLATVINSVVGLALVTTLFALIYKLMPRAQVRWADVWVGATVTAVMFTIGKLLIGLYIGSTGVASGFGAAGSLVVLLIWVYYSAQIFLMGAEFTWVWAHAFGSRRGQVRPGPAGMAEGVAKGAEPGTSTAAG